MRTFKTWADLANHYSLVLFNDCTKLVRADNNSFFEGVIMEWQEKHLENCQSQLEGNECECEPIQWYAIAVSEFDQKYLNETYNTDIFYSGTLGIYILPVYHYGTSWDYVALTKKEL